MGAFKLGKMTFGSLFKKPETIMYPIETKPQPKGLKGHITIVVDDCILCGMCDRNCSTDCITVDKQASTWAIDRLQCVQCGYCITVCPKKCLAMDPNYAPATTVHEADVFVVPEREKPQKKKPEAAAGKAEVKPEAKQEAQPAAQPAAVSEAQDGAKEKDAQIEALLSIMDSEKAEKVRAALG